MWLLAIEIIVAIIASARGQGLLPFGLVGATAIMGLVLGIAVGYDSIAFSSVVDWIVTAIVTGMAIIGKEKSDDDHLSSGKDQELISTPIARISCPYCAELILPEAKNENFILAPNPN